MLNDYFFVFLKMLGGAAVHRGRNNIHRTHHRTLKCRQSGRHLGIHGRFRVAHLRAQLHGPHQGQMSVDSNLFFNISYYYYYYYCGNVDHREFWASEQFQH